jgi:hypothetical protein
MRSKAERRKRRTLILTAFFCGVSSACFVAVAQTPAETLIFDTAVLGMTGWRTAPVSVETAVLGMTGWRTAPVSVETAVLGMTGWRTAPTTVETAVLGMTGWRTGPEPPERTEPFKVTGANLTLFHNSQPLPKKLEVDCPVSIGHRALFTSEGNLPGSVKYHFEWTSAQRSTDYSKLDKGDRKDPLYEPPSAFHEFPYPLPAKDQGGGGKAGPKGFAGEQPKPKGPAGEAAGPANEHQGSVRVVVPNPYGAPVVSGWAPYHIVCRPKVEVLSGTLELRDPGGPACPRHAQAALSLKTNVAGPVPYSLDCTGDRSWSQTATAHKTAPATYLAVAVIPFSVEHKEQVNCVLKSQSPPKVLALRGHAYDCAKTGPDRIVTPPPTKVPPRVVVDPARPTCVGGRLLITGTKGARYACHCPAGQTVVSTGPNSYLCQRKTTVGITCTGGISPSTVSEGAALAS